MGTYSYIPVYGPPRGSKAIHFHCELNLAENEYTVSQHSFPSRSFTMATRQGISHHPEPQMRGTHCIVHQRDVDLAEMLRIPRENLLGVIAVGFIPARSRTYEAMLQDITNCPAFGDVDDPNGRKGYGSKIWDSFHWLGYVLATHLTGSQDIRAELVRLEHACFLLASGARNSPGTRSLVKLADVDLRVDNVKSRLMRTPQPPYLSNREAVVMVQRRGNERRVREILSHLITRSVHRRSSRSDLKSVIVPVRKDKYPPSRREGRIIPSEHRRVLAEFLPKES